MADESGSFEVNGKRYSLPTGDLTMGEMCDAERYFGVEFGDVMQSSSMRMVSALIWIAVRREDPSVEVEDIRELPASVFESFAAAGDAVPPAEEKSGEKEPSGDSSEPVGVRQDDPPEPTGSPISAIGSRSDLVTSKT